MNFFEHQEQARKRTGYLIFLFVLAVITLITMVTVVFAVAFGSVNYEYGQEITFDFIAQQLNQREMLWIVAGVIFVIASGSLYKLIQLTNGGKFVAEMLGGKPVSFNTDDLHERKLLNIVEEMAIASGTPVPPVYVMQNERGINAFAAGFTINDAVIGVTRGCIERLNREELQGVIAHEFSHILHGDMKLNLRLMGILHGILVVGLIGGNFVRLASYSGRSKDGVGLAAVMFLVGLCLIVIGYSGVLFGNLIKAAVSRQREYLADSSAVQFTRNPTGIANALKKIGGYSEGTYLDTASSSETAHLLFGAGASQFLSGIFATHPPLERRIKLIEPSWDGQFLEAHVISYPTEGWQGLGPDDFVQFSSEKDQATSLTAVSTADALNHVGQPNESHLSYAQQTLAHIPELWLTSARDSKTAAAVIFALLLDQNYQIRTQQFNYIEHFDSDLFKICHELHRVSLNQAYRLPLIDIALPHLAQIEKDKLERYLSTLQQIIHADNDINLFEWTLYSIVIHYLKPLQGKAKPTPAKYDSLQSVASGCLLVFSTLAIAGNKEPDQSSAFNKAMALCGLADVEMLTASELSVAAMQRYLEKLNGLYPEKKKVFLQACAACIASDDEITPIEAELLRAIADSLDCPIPPIVI